MTKSLTHIGNDGLVRLFSKPAFRANAGIRKELIKLDTADESAIDLAAEVRMIVLNSERPTKGVKTIYWVWGQECGVAIIFSNRYTLADELLKFRGRDVSHMVRSCYVCEQRDLQFVDIEVTHTVVALSHETRQMLNMV